LTKQARVAVTALMVFTHVYTICTLPKTCRLHALHPWRFGGSVTFVACY